MPSENTNAAMVIENTEAEVEAGTDTGRVTKEDTKVTAIAVVSATTLLRLHGARGLRGRDQDHVPQTVSEITLVASGVALTLHPIAVTKTTGTTEKEHMNGHGDARA
jgi:hypothetical protein